MSIHSKLFDLEGRVALITGGASGLGLAIAEALVLHGGHVMLGSRTQEKLERAAGHLEGLVESHDDRPIASGVRLDVTQTSSVEHAIKKTLDVFGRLDVLVNSAGVILRKPTADLAPEEFNSLYDTHVTGSLRCAQAAGAVFREQHEGVIINLGSITSFADVIEVTAYASAKSAVLGLTRSLANEWAGNGIRCNAIIPGFFPTDLNRSMIERTDRGRRILEHTPAGRFGEAEELGGAAVYLASRAGRFVNGQTLVVDGGFLACGVGRSVAPWAADEADEAAEGA